ncbi:DinB family protein [bacterium]|nr:DinB family protein [bacterium]
MFTNAQQFIGEYTYESGITRSLFANLTDATLGQAQADGLYNLGQIAWHISSSRCYLFGQTGFDMPDQGHGFPENMTADMIRQNYDMLLERVLSQAATKSDDDLNVVYRFFDKMNVSLGQMMRMVISHEVHHRGQLSVLMRQAGLGIPGIYGPNAEDTKIMMEQMAQQG